MTENEIRAQAMINELAFQRLNAMDRCATLQGELAIAQARIKELENPRPEPTGATPDGASS